MQNIRKNTAHVRKFSISLIVILMLSILVACGDDEVETGTGAQVDVNPTVTLDTTADVTSVAVEPTVDLTPTFVTDDVTVTVEPTMDMTEPTVDITEPMTDTEPVTDTAMVSDTVNLTALDAITADPAAYLGKTVTVVGDVNVVTGERSFSIADSTFLDLNEILIVGVPTSDLTVTEGLEGAEVPVVVTGTVQLFTSADVEDDWGLDLDNNDIEVEYDSRPIIVADSAQFVPGAISLEAITDDPTAYIGQPVAVNGYVNVGVDETAFTIADNTFLDLHEVLVVDATNPNQPLTLDTGTPVRVMGTLQVVDSEALEDQTGLNIDENIFNVYNNKPVIIADSIQFVNREEIGLDEITENPMQYAGRLLTVSGEVNVVKSPRSFTIASAPLIDEDEILVIGANDQVATGDLTDGEAVKITGTVRNLVVADIERDYGLDLDPELEAEFENKPVIIATNVVGDK